MTGITPLIDGLLHQVLGRTAQPPPAADSGTVFPITRTPGLAGGAQPDTDVSRRSSGLESPAAAVQLTDRAHLISDLLEALSRLPADTSSAASGIKMPAGISLQEWLASGRPLPGLAYEIATATPHVPLAAALRQQISQSGLFYEADLLDWYQGRTPLADLSAHPQTSTARLDALLAWRQAVLLTQARYLPVSESRVSPPWVSTRPDSGGAIPTALMAYPALASRREPATRESQAVSAYREGMQHASSAIATDVDEWEGADPGVLQQQLRLVLGQPLNWQGLLLPGLHAFFSLYFPPTPRPRDMGSRKQGPREVLPVASVTALAGQADSEEEAVAQWRVVMTFTAEQGAVLEATLLWYQLASPVALVVILESRHGVARDALLESLPQALHALAPRVHVRRPGEAMGPPRYADGPAMFETASGSEDGAADVDIRSQPQEPAERAFPCGLAKSLGTHLQQHATEVGLPVHASPELVALLAQGLPARRTIPQALFQCIVEIAHLWSRQGTSGKGPRADGREAP